MHKYYINTTTTSYVSFKLLDKSSKVIDDYADNPCYGSIAHGFEKKARQIHIYHAKNKVPYSVTCIKRWIDDLNDMGFPCSFVTDELLDDAMKQEQFAKTTVNTDLTDMALSIMRHGVKPWSPNIFYNFYVDLNSYEDKNHLFSTLSLIRCIFESGICYVPEVYFSIMDKDPGIDKLEACQLAHKKVTSKEKRYDPASYANTGHMVTYDGNGINITKDALMAKFKKARLSLRDKGYLGINASWNGSKQ